MSNFKKLKILILFMLCLVSAKLLMIFGYMFYLPPLASWVNEDYIAVMKFQFLAMGIVCAFLTFFLGKIFLLKIEISRLIFMGSGILFNLYSPEGSQQHWPFGFIQLSILYLLFGLIVMFLLSFLSTRNNNA